MKRLAVLLVLLAAFPALAEQPGPAPDLDTQTYVKMLRDQRDEAHRLASDAQAEYTAAVVAFRKKAADMDTYLKACGDKPGCTSPVSE